MAGRFNGITDSQWSIIKPLLPHKKTRFGRPYANMRSVINSILHVLIEGGRWVSVPNGDGWAPKSTAHGWLKKLSKNEVLDKILSDVVRQADAKGVIDWKDVSFDGSFVNGIGGGEMVEYGYKGKGSTIHALTDKNGLAINATITPANGDERSEVMKLLSASHIRKDGSIENGCGDKGYDSKDVRNDLISVGIKPIIVYRKFEGRPQKIASGAVSKKRWVIERYFSWLKRKFRRISNRWERKNVIWKGFVKLGVIMILIEKLIFG